MAILAPIIGAVAGIGGSIYASNKASSASKSAAQTQAQAAQAGIDEQKRQFDALVQLMSPYTQAGAGALGAQQNLLGLGGAQAQQDAINALQTSPQFQALTQQGENALLQNASATGGLRGGNLQGALTQYRPQVLSNLINQQFANLGGISQLGQAAAAGQAAQGMQSASNIGNLLAQQGAATAGGQLAQGQIAQQNMNNILGIGSNLLGYYNKGF